MKSLILALTLLAGVCLGSGSYSTTVTTVSTVVSPRGGLQPTVVAVGDTVAQGDVIIMGGWLFMVTEAGSLSGLATDSAGTGCNLGVRHYPGIRGSLKERTMLFVDVLSGEVWFTLGGSAAKVDEGVRLMTGDRMWFDMDETFSAISTNGAVLGTVEVR